VAAVKLSRLQTLCSIKWKDTGLEKRSRGKLHCRKSVMKNLVRLVVILGLRQNLWATEPVGALMERPEKAAIKWKTAPQPFSGDIAERARFIKVAPYHTVGATPDSRLPTDSAEEP